MGVIQSQTHERLAEPFMPSCICLHHTVPTRPLLVSEVLETEFQKSHNLYGYYSTDVVKNYNCNAWWINVCFMDSDCKPIIILQAQKSTTNNI